MHATKKGTPTAILAVIAVAIWILATGCSSASQPVSHAQPPTATAQQPVAVQQPPTAREIAAQLHATKFVSKDVGDARMVWGMTSAGNLWIDGTDYGVNVFTTKTALDRWLKVASAFPGFSPKWKTDTSVVYPSLAFVRK